MICRLLILASLSLSAVASAAAPAQPTLTRYSKLWLNSVFTTKPDIVKVEENPLEDYALGGITKLEDGYFAILLNRKKPEDKVVIYPGGKNDFEVVDVDWPSTSWRDAVVTVKTGNKTGTVKFEDKLLTVKTATPKAAAPKKPKPKAAATNPGQPKASSTPTTRKPRPRVVVPRKK